MSRSTYSGRAGAAVSRERLDRYRRYASLVSLQEAALDADDLDLVQAYGEQIVGLQEEIGAMKVRDDASASPDEETTREAMAALEEAIGRTERLAVRIGAIRKSGGADVRTALVRRAQARSYVSEEAGLAVERPARLDVTS